MAARNQPRYLIIHCSASNCGTWRDINRWHKARGWWRGLPEEYKAQWVLRYGFWPRRIHCGYHNVICNGFPTYRSWAKDERQRKFNGKIEPGRPDHIPGAHCPGHNYNSLSVCLIGNPGIDDYTDAQWESLIHWCVTKCQKYDIPVDRIGQHSMYDERKPFCASINVEQLQSDVAMRLHGD